MTQSRKPVISSSRFEAFGGIVSCEDPPFLAWVDQNFMRELGHADSPLWHTHREYLSAPTEVHFSVTNRCAQRCSGCYMGSSSCVTQEDDLSTREVKAIIRTLADMGVFHIALGGGEAFLRDDFAEIVEYCRHVGLVPNLTTNGQNIGSAQVALCRHMGQVNVSIDGVGNRYSINGRDGSFSRADSAVTLLVEAGVNTGINCVVSSKNFAHIEDVVGYAAEKNLNEVEFLKYKPSGRARQKYEDYRLTKEMIAAFYPRVETLSRVYGVELKIDCSFVPAMVYHNPPKQDLEKLAVAGCDGGNILMSIRGNGVVSGCSFVDGLEQAVMLPGLWDSSSHLSSFRRLVAQAREPCRSCPYLDICRCGCRAVAIFETGDFFAPDPECPRVVEYLTNSQ